MGLTLQYKGMNGSVEFNQEDRIFHGRLLDLRDGFEYEGVDIESLEASFRAAVDKYFSQLKLSS